jgi:HEAT repeat protein
VTNSIDWQALALRLNELNRARPSADHDSAKRAIEISLGEADLEAAVDYCVSEKSRSEPARSVLRQLHSWQAMQRCYQLFQEGNSETRRSAVELLRAIADRKVMPWIDELLNDADPVIQYLGAEILDELVWSGSVRYEECSDLLETIRQHPNAEVRVMGALIWSVPHKKAYAY